MPALPQQVQDAWNNKEKAVILATVDQNGIPNAIYASCTALYDEQTIVIADNYFHRTRQNIQSGSSASVLFITTEGTSYQIKGKIELITSGPIFDDMKSWNPTKHPGHAAAAIQVETVFSSAVQLL